jgi:hypothetical protein
MSVSIAKRVLVELTQEEEMFRRIDRVRKAGDAVIARVRVRVAQQVRGIANEYAGGNSHSEAQTSEAVNA